MSAGLSKRILRGLLAGAALGATAHALAGESAVLESLLRYVTDPVGKIFLRLLFMLVIPLVVSALALGVAGLGDRFREFGPLAGSIVMLGGEISPGFSSFYSRQTVEADARKYLRFGSTTSLLAARARDFYSTGDFPDIFWFGGNMDLRGYEYASFVGNQGFFANVELRLPLIDVMRTPIGLLGPVRGVPYVGMGGAKYKGQPYTLWSSDPGLSYVKDRSLSSPSSPRR